MNKISKNIVASILPQIMNIISNLILPTMIITIYGSEVNGLITSLKSIVGYISIVGAGIAIAVTQSLYVPVAEKDTKTVKGMLHAASNMFNKYGYIFCFIVLIVALVYPFFFNASIGYWDIVFLMIVVSIASASEFFAIGRYRALLYASQKTYVCTIAQATSILLSLILAIVMLKLKVNIIIVQLSISMVYVFRAFFLAFYVKKYYPELSDFKKEKPIQTAISKRKDAMVHQLSGLAVSGSQATILTIMVGLNAASIYSIYNIVFSGLQSICSNLSTAVTPFLGRELALKKHDRLVQMYDLIEFSFFNIVTLIYSVTVVMIVPFVKLYTKGADISYEFPAFALIFTFMSAFYILKLPSTSLINSSGCFRETKSRAIIEASLTIILSIIFTMIIGIEGVVLGTGIALMWRCLDTILYSDKYIIKRNSLKSILRLLRSLVIISMFAIFQHFVLLDPNNFKEWIGCSCVIFAIVIIIVFLNSIIFDKVTFFKMVDIFKRAITLRE